MTERPHESAVGLLSDVSTTVRTNGTTPSVPQTGGLVNDQDLSVRMPQAAATPGILHSNLPAPVAVVRTSRRHRVLRAIGAFMRHPFSRRASRRTSNDVLSSSRRGPSTTLANTTHNVAIEYHGQHADDLLSRLPPQPSLGVDLHQLQGVTPSSLLTANLPQIPDEHQLNEAIASAANPVQSSSSLSGSPRAPEITNSGDNDERLSCPGNDHDKSLPELPDTAGVDSPRHDVESPIRSSRVRESDVSLTTPVGVSPTISSGESAGDTCPADFDSTHAPSNGHSLVGQSVVPRDDYFGRWEDFWRPGAELSMAGASAFNDEHSSDSEDDIPCHAPASPLPMPHDNSDILSIPAPTGSYVPLPPVEPDDMQLDALANEAMVERSPSTNGLGLSNLEPDLEELPVRQIDTSHLPALHAPHPSWTSWDFRFQRGSSAGPPMSLTMPGPWLPGVATAAFHHAYGEGVATSVDSVPRAVRSPMSEALVAAEPPAHSSVIEDEPPPATQQSTPNDDSQVSATATSQLLDAAQTTLRNETPDAALDEAPPSSLSSASTEDLDYASDDEDELWAYIGEQHVSGMYAGLQLVVIVDTKADLEHSSPGGDSKELFKGDYGAAMSRLTGFCEADQRYHRLTQLHLCVYRARDTSGQDIMTRTMLSLGNYLGCLHAVEIVMKEENNRTLDQGAIRGKLRQLRYLRIDGKAAVDRFRLFPLHQVTQLDIKAKMSPADVLALIDLASKLELLVLDFYSGAGRPRLVRHDPNENNPRPLQVTKARLPHAMHATADNPESMLYILQSFAWAADVRLTVTEFCPPKVAELFAARQWSLCVRNAST
ncbi:hypothetical protein BD626DRAFT_570855 [Schizophyllum amplum]|uniref:Uncharacterized protein n=1 Tax=Schizophyllum amplum TaxID=97359 RepID=A0A550CAD7_9AGAR|nr:hypothetical protein BD626DRAFT_570855 [Auriculariopsis ampla]